MAVDKHAILDLIGPNSCFNLVLVSTCYAIGGSNTSTVVDVLV